MDISDRATDLETLERERLIANARSTSTPTCTTGEIMECEDCGEEIPEARRKAIPGVKLCTFCQSENERG